MIERVDMEDRNMIFIKFEDSSDFIQVNTMDSAWREIAEHGPDSLEFIEVWDSASQVDDLKLV
jgi:hypothetical protein